MYLSGNPKNKTEAARWVRIGIELTVLCPRTERPIDQREGMVEVIGQGWSAIAILTDGIVTKVK
ncbi:MAG: hypothetical protein JWP89_1314 [Schlesneria sp.]|nr:hypothetical protein [Schlesneria sp.]